MPAPAAPTAANSSAPAVAPQPPMPLTLEALLPDDDMMPTATTPTTQSRSISNDANVLPSYSRHSGGYGPSYGAGGPNGNPSAMFMSTSSMDSNNNANGANGNGNGGGMRFFQGMRTKMCHYHLIGRPCPFAERCAFAHGDDELNTPIPQAALERVWANYNNQRQSYNTNSMNHHHHHHHNNGNIMNYNGVNNGSAPSYDGNSHRYDGAPARPTFAARPVYQNSAAPATANGADTSTSSNTLFLSMSSRNVHAQNAPILHLSQSGAGPTTGSSANVTRVNSINGPPTKHTSLAAGAPSAPATVAAEPAADDGTATPIAEPKKALNADAAPVMYASPLTSNVASAAVSPSHPPPPAYSSDMAEGRYHRAAGRNPPLRIFACTSPLMSDRGAMSFPSSPTLGLEGSGRFRYDPYSSSGYAVIAC